MDAPEPPTIQKGANLPPVRFDPAKFVGQVVMVTGAAQGIGAATADMFAAQGASLILVDMNRSTLEATASRLRQHEVCPRVATHVCDLSIESEVQSTINQITTSHGKIDVLAHLAGIFPSTPVLEESTSGYERVIRVNLTSTFYLIRAVLGLMNRAGYGRIITTASSTIFDPPPGLAAYVASKSGVVGLTRVAAREAGPGVTVNMVSPGLIYHETTAKHPELRKGFEYVLGRQCVKRCGLPKDVAHMICFIASPETEWITGQLFEVSGGMIYA